MDPFAIHRIRLSKMTDVIECLNALGKCPDHFDIPDDIICTHSISDLVNYVISNYYA